MWIRSQNRRTLSNGIISYVVTLDDEIIQKNENNSNDNSCYIKLAKYSTEAKALKVLDEIQMCITKKENDIYNSKFGAYQMPQDEQVVVFERQDNIEVKDNENQDRKKHIYVDRVSSNRNK